MNTQDFYPSHPQGTLVWQYHSDSTLLNRLY